MNLGGILMRTGRGENAQTRSETFQEQLSEAQDNCFATFLKGVRYEEGMKGKWSITDAKMTYTRTVSMYQENKTSILPGLSCVLGCLCNAMSEPSVSNDDISWYIRSTRELIEETAEFVQNVGDLAVGMVEYTFLAYSDMVAGLSGCIKNLDDTYQLQLLELLQKCMGVLQNGNRGRLTVAHRPFVVICVEHQLYNLLTNIVNETIVEVTPGLKALDYLYYFYYAGVTHIALKNFKQALDNLAMCQIVPGEASSLIQVDAHKKYILISLMLHAKVISLPQFGNHRLTKTLQKCCRAYTELEDPYRLDDGDTLRKLIERNHEQYVKDYNWGLCRQVLDAHEIRRVRKLKNVYASCSLEVAAEQCCIETPERAKKILLLLIKRGEISATIDANDVVTFSASQNVNANRYAALSQQLSEVMQLTNLAEHMFYSTMKSEDYIKATTPALHTAAKEMEDLH